jgi:splicing factor 3A subunit 1
MNADSPAQLSLPDEINKPPAGVVLPPRDIRAIVEKTAGYVARNGVVFEDRMREKEKHNPKFSFLSPNDAYSAFYAWRLEEVRAGRGTAVSAGRVGEAAAAPVPEKQQGPAAPPEFHFSARMPNISAQDLEVVKLTALFVAKNGRSFMTTLSQKETRNYQFDFLRPQHSLYQFFTRLVDQYTILLQSASADGIQAQKARIQELEGYAADRFSILGRAKQRAEWVKYQEEQKQKKEEEAEKERMEYAQIDWHDFVVVETVLFEEADDQADLPPPTSLNDLQSASLEQKAAMSLQPHDRRIEEAMPTDEDSSLFYNQPQSYSMPPPPVPQSFNSYEPPPQSTEFSYNNRSTSTHEDDEERAIAERTEARERAQAAQAAAKGGAGQPMRIRNDYVPRAQAKRQSIQMTICPHCKQQIPVDELESHMRSKLPPPPLSGTRRAGCPFTYPTIPVPC